MFLYMSLFWEGYGLRVNMGFRHCLKLYNPFQFWNDIVKYFLLNYTLNILNTLNL